MALGRQLDLEGGGLSPLLKGNRVGGGGDLSPLLQSSKTRDGGDKSPPLQIRPLSFATSCSTSNRGVNFSAWLNAVGLRDAISHTGAESDLINNRQTKKG
jgi:hypothetical protein